MKHFSSHVLSFLFSSLIFIMLLGMLFISPRYLANLGPLLSTEMSAWTHQSVQIQGKITPRLFPKPSIHLQTVQIGSDPADTAATTYAITLHDLTLQLSVSQLLHGHLLFKAIRVHDARIHLPSTLDTFDIAIQPPAPTHQSSTKHSFLHIEYIFLKTCALTFSDPSYPMIQLTQTALMTAPLHLINQPYPLQFQTYLQLIRRGTAPISTAISFKGEGLFTPQTKLPFALRGELALNNFYWGTFHLDTLQTSLQTQRDYLLFNPLSSKLYHGTTSGDASLNLNTLRVFVNQSGSNLETDALLKNLWPNPALSGSLDFSLHLHMPLFAPNVFRSLAANGILTFRNGAIEHFNLDTVLKYVAQKVHDSLELKPEPQPLSNAVIFQNRTPFQSLTFEYDLRGIQSIYARMLFKSPQLSLQGRGIYHPENTSLQAHLKAQVYFEDPDLLHMQSLIGGSFPLVISGPIERLNIEPDMSGLMPHVQTLVVHHFLRMPTKDLQKQLNFLLQVPHAPTH